MCSIKHVFQDSITYINKEIFPFMKKAIIKLYYLSIDIGVV